MCALRWSRIDLELGVIDVRRSYRLRHGVGVEKDTKTHQMRRIALDSETVALLIEHKRRCAERMRLLGGIDLRTVAGRLGHGGGGATTLRVYAAWVAATDRKAAEILGSRMPKRPTRRPVNG